MPSFFVRRASPILEKKITEYINEYRKYISYICKKRRFLREDWEDMESYIILELVANFKNAWRYDDFDWVTRSIIRRKAIDFTNLYIKKNKEVGEAIAAPSSDDEIINSHFISKALQNFSDSEHFKEIKDYIYHLNYEINNLPNKVYFSDWDRDFLGMILDLYDSGCDLTREDILACMGFEQNEVYKLNVKLNSFRNKVKKYLEPDNTKDIQKNTPTID